MLRWAVTFLVIALVAGVLGFSGIAAGAVDIARILFIVFIALFLIAGTIHALKGRAPPI